MHLVDTSKQLEPSASNTLQSYQFLRSFLQLFMALQHFVCPNSWMSAMENVLEQCCFIQQNFLNITFNFLYEPCLCCPEMSKAQDDEVGDGTTSVAVLASELLKVRLASHHDYL